MDLFTPSSCGHPPTHFIEIVAPDLPDCPPEENLRYHNYRLLNENIHTYTPIGDNHTSPNKGKLMPSFDLYAMISPPRAKILELLRPEDPGRDALEAIMRPAPRRGLTRPLDEDTRRFLERALQCPSAYSLSKTATSEPQIQPPGSVEKILDSSISTPKSQNLNAERSLADELKEAEEDERAGGHIRSELLKQFRRSRGGGIRDAVERERLGKLALSVEDDEGDEDNGLSAAARRIDALLAESRDLHEELAGIHEDLQAQSARACQCAAATRALVHESQALRYMDDVVALLKGNVAAAGRARAWPFAIGIRHPERNYII